MKHKHLLLPALSAALIIGACSGNREDISVVPYPNNVKTLCGEFTAAGADFFIDPQVDDASRELISNFAERLSFVTDSPSTITAEATGEGFSFIPDSNLEAEAYTLDISRRKACIKASSSAGFRYAIITLEQMLPKAVFGDTPSPQADWSIRCAKIEDSPRFAYRGLLMDVARHFFDVEEVKRYIDIMELHKMNVLHWHLTDDQGWRIEIKRYPKLTEIGSTRKGTVIKKNWDQSDGIAHGGFYTQDEIKEIIEYADSKGIVIIPEVDLPGHMLAAIASYPELGCTSGPYEVWQRWGVSEDVLCVGKEETIAFLEGVLEEVTELFPSEYIHIGGDECPKTRWENCPLCQAKIKELGLKDSDKFKAEHYLQSYVMARIEKFLNSKGKKAIGWDEILEGELSEGATVMSWRGSEGGIEASKMGHDVIMTPNSHFYFDYYQNDDISLEPFGIGGYVPLDKVYSYEPFTDDMDEATRGHILGVQANLWTEYISTPQHLEYMLLPRAAALSEVQWTMPERKDSQRFMNSLLHLMDIYDTLGYNYAKTAFEVHGEAKVNNEKNCVEVTLKTYGDAPIRYTVDGSDPDENSALYTAPVEIRNGCTLKAIAMREGVKTRPYRKVFEDSKAIGRPVTLNTEPLERLRFNAPQSLTDGIRGAESYATGEWVGWDDEPIDLTIEMDGETTYGSVTIGAYVQKWDDIFNPLSLTVFTSDDNITFNQVGSSSFPVEGEKVYDGLKEYTVDFPTVASKYVRVKVNTLKSLPQWHERHGKQAFTIIDEVIVK